MTASADISLTELQRCESLVKNKPFGMRWILVILLSEILFAFCRANVQDGYNADDPTGWFVGLSPFFLAALGRYLFNWRSGPYLETWIAALAVIIATRIFDVAQFIEYPLFMRLDEGIARNLVCGAIYAAAGSAVLMATSANSRAAFKTTAGITGVLLVCTTLALVVFSAPFSVV